MGIPTLIGLLCLILWDIANFKAIHRRAVNNILRQANMLTGAIVLGSAVYLYLNGAMLDEIFLCYTAILFIVYMYCREKFAKYCYQKNLEIDDPRRLLTADFLYVILVWMFGSLMFGLVIFNAGILFPAWIGEFDELLFTTIFSTVLVLYLIDESVAGLDDKGFLHHVSFDGKKRNPFAVWFIPAGIGFVFALCSVSVIFSRDVPVQTPLAEMLENVTSPVSIFLFLFLATVIAPLVEEVIFRGYCFNMLSRIRGQRTALYVTSLSFAFMHVGQYWGDWMAIGIITVLGFALTLFRVFTGTTLSSVVMHYAYNGSVALISAYLIVRDNPQMLEAMFLLR